MEDLDKSSNNIHNSTSSFVNIITNEKGQKYYLYILEYFKKIELSEYKEIYKTDTVREYMKLKTYMNDTAGKLYENSSKNIKILTKNFFLIKLK